MIRGSLERYELGDYNAIERVHARLAVPTLLSVQCIQNYFNYRSTTSDATDTSRGLLERCCTNLFYCKLLSADMECTLRCDLINIETCGAFPERSFYANHMIRVSFERYCKYLQPRF